MTSQYPHPIPLVRPWNDGNGWKVDTTPGEGLVWLVEVAHPDPREGTYDVYVIADTVEVNEGRLEMALRARPQEFTGHIPATLYTRTFAPGVWREYHLIPDAKAVAQHSAEMFKDGDDG